MGSWALFMRDEFVDLRRCVCATDKELVQFRQLVVQMVMATDVMDKEIGKLRKERWNKAFNIDTSRSEDNEGNDCARALDSSLGCFTYHATLECILQVERKTLSRNVPCIQTRSSRERSFLKLVQERNWFIRFLCHPTG